MRQILELLERDATLTPDTLATMTGLPVDGGPRADRRLGALRRDPPLPRGGGLGRRRRRPHPRDRHRVHRRVDHARPRCRVRRRGGPDRAVRRGAQRLPRLGQPGPALHGHRPDASAPCRDFVSQKLSTIDRVRSTATHFVLKTYKRDGDAFRPPSPTTVCRLCREAAQRRSSPPARRRGSGSSSTSPPSMDDVISLGVGEPDFVTPVAGARSRDLRPRARLHHLHLQRGPPAAARADLRRPRRPLRRASYAWTRRVPDHHRRLRRPRPGAAGAAQPRRRGDRPRALLRRLRAVHRVRGRGAGPRADPLGGRVRHRRRRSPRPRSPRAPRRSCSARPRTRPARSSPAPRWRRWSGWPSERDLYLVSDEIYDRLTYDAAHTCLRRCPAPATARCCSAGSPRRTR